MPHIYHNTLFYDRKFSLLYLLFYIINIILLQEYNLNDFPKKTHNDILLILLIQKNRYYINIVILIYYYSKIMLIFILYKNN
ncbi:hypothetical protein PFFVO_00886 [Plasmodium falciparum Vietnam Oak-Knoll (FVO)]|uniref:Uncharacterized protein n=1 Tax=Plasmodium falciparum Vietnam Oak-Knoll (FVO) TaxID=1036723 RepID=A0A024VCF5_PLAFA|nr:hypothetical protein PFFVO_00886 [Plasmodium falciparum Vietnam Oak-Knoll (FVO)]